MFRTIWNQKFPRIFRHKQEPCIRSIEFHFHEFLCIWAIFVIIPKKMHENQH